MRLLVLAIGLIGAAGTLPAGQVCPNGGTLQQYIDLSVSDGGCDIGTDFILSNWAYVNAAVFSNPVTPEDIVVSYSINVFGAPQVSFSGLWGADVPVGTATGVGVLGFSLEARNTQFGFTGVTLNATGSVSEPFLDIAGLVPTGAASVTEVNCIGGLADLRDSNNVLGLLPLPGNLGDIGCSGGGVEAGVAVSLGSGSGVSANANIDFGERDNFVDVIKIITVSDLYTVPLVADGSGQITSFSQDFAGDVAAVPEPSTLLLSGLALAVTVAWRRQRRRG